MRLTQDTRRSDSTKNHHKKKKHPHEDLSVFHFSESIFFVSMKHYYSFTSASIRCDKGPSFRSMKGQNSMRYLNVVVPVRLMTCQLYLYHFVIHGRVHNRCIDWLVVSDGVRDTIRAAPSILEAIPHGSRDDEDEKEEEKEKEEPHEDLTWSEEHSHQDNERRSRSCRMIRRTRRRRFVTKGSIENDPIHYPRDRTTRRVRRRTPGSSMSIDDDLKGAVVFVPRRKGYPSSCAGRRKRNDDDYDEWGAFVARKRRRAPIQRREHERVVVRQKEKEERGRGLIMTSFLDRWNLWMGMYFFFKMVEFVQRRLLKESVPRTILIRNT